MNGFDYAQARLQARYGHHPTPALWSRLAATRSLAAYIETARATSMAPWVENISRGGDVHDIEHSIRGNFNSAAEQAASWIPEAWRPATRWLTWLPYLPALAYLLRGEPLLHWIGEGHRLRPFAHESLNARREALLEQGHGWALAAGERGLPLTATWSEAWVELWPVNAHGPMSITDDDEALRRVRPAHRLRLDDPNRAVETVRGTHPTDYFPDQDGRLGDELRRFQGLIETHLYTFGTLRSDQTVGARQALRDTLRRTFRNHAASPLAVYAYLGLLALDLEQLRSELVRRALFPDREAA